MSDASADAAVHQDLAGGLSYVRAQSFGLLDPSSYNLCGEESSWASVKLNSFFFMNSRGQFLQKKIILNIL